MTTESVAQAASRTIKLQSAGRAHSFIPMGHSLKMLSHP
jgi:hypothetical protein